MVVTRLQGAGHIDRQPDPEDRRRNLVTINRSGTGYLEQVQTNAGEAQAELLSALDANERHQLHSLLAKALEAHKLVPA